MARKTTVVLEDDLDGGSASQQVTFALDGVEYQIDLNDSNADKLRSALDPFVTAGRRTGGRQRRQSAPTSSNRGEWLGQVRGWARANGHEVATRGRVPKSVIDAYTEAHA